MQEADRHPSTFDPIAFAEAPTLPLLFARRCERSPDTEAYRQFEAATGGWRSVSWGETQALVGRWRAALAREGLAPGERVAVLLRNSLEWVCYDQAALSLGLVVVPLYATDSAGNLAYILGHCGARVLLLEEEARWRALEALRPQFPALARVVCLGPAAGDATLRHVREWLEDAPEAPAATAEDPGALATIVYTSGTTGRPKGVMLSHGNILSNIDGVLRTVRVYREDLFLSFLPLSHALERTVGYYAAIATGSAVAYARSVQELAEDLQAIRPTVLISVPRIYERIYARMQQDLQARGAPARQLFDWAESIGWQRFEAGQHRGEPPGPLAALMWPVLRHLVADRLLSRLGGRLRLAVSGGAPMSHKLTHCFVGLGLPLLQGYGLSEAAPIVTANRFEDNVPESVGRPIPGVELKLGDRDELLVRGPNVMLGYWRDAEKTAEVLGEDGWLRTGDIAHIDAAGHVSIVGRIKEILVTSTGEKVPPADLEMAIAEDPLFEQVMVLGEARPYVAALVVLNRETWRALAASLQVDADSAEALQQPEVRRAVLGRLEERVASFPSYARVRQVWLTLEPWTTDEGLITPTLKLRRSALQERFAATIATLYEARA
ncbi:AMP-dependent synthetase/ligase [Ramlibacter sp. AN1133]|uniref:AMP-dependent synthetase/ligase n=1 Tax=Ramlibacter sp. AN1133 TaxID=3133429 RepID=UPI0030C46262